jgi:DNA repair protein REV1
MGTKLGIKLYEYARGIDYTDMTVIPSPKSIGVEIAWGVRVKDSGEMDQFVLNLTEELCKRMKEHEPELKGTQLVVKIYQRHRDAPVNPPKFMGSGYCYVFTKSSGLFDATNDLKDLAKVAKEITRNLGCPPQDLRGVGLQAVKLDNDAEEKISASQTKLNFVPNIQSDLELKRKLVAPTTPTKKRARTESPQKQPGNSVLSLSLTPITRKAAKTLTQQFKLQRQRNRMAGSDTNAILQPAVKLPSDIDISVFQELPSQIREELLEDYRRRQPNNRNARNKAKTPRSPRPSTHLIFPSYKPIVFPDGHSTNVQQVRDHISAWINNGIELGYLPHYDDVNKIEKYLIDVSAHDKDWTKAVRLIEWMKRLVNGNYSSADAEREWKFLIDMYAEVVRERLLARGLQVYKF